MAHENSLKNLRMWQKGQSGNPKGRYVSLPPELKAIKSLSSIEVLKIISKYARMTWDELEANLQQPKTPVIERAVASIFSQSIEKGDFMRLSFLLDRAIGKVKEIEFEDEEEVDAAEEVKQLSMAELLTLVKTTLPGDKNGKDLSQDNISPIRSQPPVDPT